MQLGAEGLGLAVLKICFERFVDFEVVGFEGSWSRATSLRFKV